MVMVRYAEATVLAAALGRRHAGRRTAHRADFRYTPRPGFLYVRSRAISSRTNDNYDTFPASEIKAAWRTFLGKPVFVNHHNEHVARMRGAIIDAALHEDTNPDGTPDTWVEVLMEVDAVRFPRLAELVMRGDIERTSMGCNVAYSICSFCGNKAETPMEYCPHIARMKGSLIYRTTASGRREAVLVSEICYGLGFFENSLLVEQPADPTAYVLGVEGISAAASRRAAAETWDASAGDDHNSYGRSGCHHTSQGRWLGHKVADDDSGTLEERLARVHEPVQPHQYLIDGAREYARSVGLPDPHRSGYAGVRTNAGRIRRLAAAYDALPADDPRAHAAFRDMADQVDRQYAHLTGPMGVKVEPVDYDPYPDHKAMMADLAQRRLRVLRTSSTGSHPFFTDEQNDRFRAVHDAFGHAATGRAFDGHGEEAAWAAHSAMFHGAGRRAMTTETRGQNGSLIVNRQFAPQKVALLPDELHEHDAALEAEAAGPRYPDPGQHPFFLANPVHPDNIVRTWTQATDEDKGQGARWYADAHRVAKAIGRGDAALGAGVLAAYSPQTAWPVNMLNAARAIEEGRGIGGPGSGIYATAAMARAAHRMITGEHHSAVLSGPKIQDFAHLIEFGGDQDPANPHVVVDRHAMSVAAGKRFHANGLDKAPLANRHYYGHVVRAYHEAANRISQLEGRPISPHQVQATTWLVQQRKNAQEDDQLGTPEARGRDVGRENAQDRWLRHQQERYPELGDQMPGWHAMLQTVAHRALAYGEQPAPGEVDTLRDESCPICSDRDSFDGDECGVCGYVAPPEQLQDPDVDMASEVDQDCGPQGLPPAAPPLSFGAGRAPDRRTGVDGMAGKNTGRSAARPPAAAVAQRSRLLAALASQQQQIGALTQAVTDLRGALATLVDLAGAGAHPRLAGLTRSADVESGLPLAPQRPAQPPADPDYADGYAAGETDAAGADLANPRSLASWTGRSPRWQVGWADGYQRATARLHRRGADEGGDPVATTSEEALAPAATDDPTSPGAAPAAANADVTPAAATDPETMDVAAPVRPFNELVDPTAVAPGVNDPPSPSNSHVDYDITAEAPSTAVPFAETGWKSTSARDPKARLFASLDLARLRRQAGLSTEDELALASRIDGSRMTDADITSEANTLGRVVKAAAQRQQQPRAAARNLVPQPAAGVRRAPGLAGTAARHATGAVTDDEYFDLL